jgi:hypothetical protein
LPQQTFPHHNPFPPPPGNDTISDAIFGTCIVLEVFAWWRRQNANDDHDDEGNTNYEKDNNVNDNEDNDDDDNDIDC